MTSPVPYLPSTSLLVPQFNSLFSDINHILLHIFQHFSTLLATSNFSSPILSSFIYFYVQLPAYHNITGSLLFILWHINIKVINVGLDFLFLFFVTYYPGTSNISDSITNNDYLSSTLPKTSVEVNILLLVQINLVLFHIGSLYY